MENLLLTKQRREHIRWLGLAHLDAARPQPMVDAALLPLIQAIYPNADPHELRRELDYLAKCDLLTIVDNDGFWRLTLTRQGIDLVEFTTPCPPGVGRQSQPT